MRSILSISILLAFFSVQAVAGGTLFGQPTFDLPPELQFSIAQTGNGATSASDILFGGISNINITKFGSNTSSLGVSVGRTIFDNHDVLQTYTVVDRISLPINLFSYSLPVGSAFFSLNLGIGSVLSFLDLRQVTEGSFRKIDPIRMRAKNISNSAWYKKAMADGPPPFTQAPDSPKQDLFHLGSSDDALYSNLWNLFSFPARLPFKADWVKRLDIGEVMVYGASGYAEFGPSVGVVLNPGALKNYMDSFNLSADYRLYMNGEFHIAVMREDENHVRVKIVRDTQNGSYYGTSGAAQNGHLFNGFIVLGYNAKVSISVVPFNFENAGAKGQDWEEGFRFDLSDPIAAAAYEQAAIGRFAQAENLALQSTANPNATVSKLFQKEEEGTANVQDRGLNIVIYNEDRSSELDSDVQTLQLPDGTHKIYESVAENAFHSNFLLIGNTSLVSRTTIDYADTVLSLILEGWIEDKATDGNKLRGYETSIDKIVDRGELFVPMPITNPVPPPSSSDSSDSDDSSDIGAPDNQATVANYGSSSFYFRIDANQAQAQQFFQTAELDKWKTLEKVFEVPDGLWENPDSRDALRGFNYLGRAVNIALIPFDIRIKQIESLIIADSIYKNWVSLAGITDPEALPPALAKQFADPVYGFEMMQVFTNAIGGTNLPFYLNATNKSFGRENVQEGEFNTVQSLENYRQTANFDQPSPNDNINLIVRGLYMNVLDENRVEVVFNDIVKPEYLYFRVDQLGISTDTKAELVVLNQGIANIGENHLILDQRDDGYGGVIAKAILALQQGNYRLSMALGEEKTDWGPVASVNSPTKQP